jgi:hypothetical protein
MIICQPTKDNIILTVHNGLERSTKMKFSEIPEGIHNVQL